jgi:tetratricopeptide (TPR) repeat protein
MDTQSLAILGDAPAAPDSDVLGFEWFTRPLAERLLRSVANAPFTLGVFGEWGQGKTTVMRLLEDHLREAGCPTVWLEPWKYNQREEVWKGLAYTLVTQVRNDDNLLKEIRRKRGSLGAFLAGFLWSHLIGREWAKDLVEAVRAEPWSPVTLHQLEAELDRLFALLHGEGQGTDEKPMVIFVDDLDRCLPEAARSVLEAIKLVLNRPRIIVVMGIAEGELSRMVSATYWKAMEGIGAEVDSDWGRSYLRKIVQVPFPVPSITDASFYRYVESCLAKSRLAESLDAREEWYPIICHACGRNLREVKRFINHLVSELDKAGASLEGKSRQTRVQNVPRAAFVLLLAWQFRDFWRHVREQLDPGDLLYRYQILLADPEVGDLAEKAESFLGEEASPFFENLELQAFFQRCMSPPREGRVPLVARFESARELVPYLQFGLLPPTEDVNGTASVATESIVDETEARDGEAVPVTMAGRIAHADGLAAEGAFGDAIDELRHVASWATEAGALRVEMATVSKIAEFYERSGDSERAWRYLQQGLNRVREVGDEEGVPLILAALRFLRAHGRLEEADRLLGEVETRFERISDPVLQAEILDEMTQRAAREGASDVVEKLILQQIESATRVGDSVRLARSRMALARQLLSRGQSDRARELVSEALRSATELGHIRIEAECLEVLAEVERQRGSIREADELLRRAAVAWESLSDLSRAFDARSKRFGLAADGGDHGKASEAYDDLVKLAWRLGDGVLEAQVHERYGRWLYEEGETHEALDILNLAQQKYGDAGLEERATALTAFFMPNPPEPW